MAFEPEVCRMRPADEAERAARFALESEAEETGRHAPGSVRFEHFVPAGVAAA